MDGHERPVAALTRLHFLGSVLMSLGCFFFFSNKAPNRVLFVKFELLFMKRLEASGSTAQLKTTILQTPFLFYLLQREHWKPSRLPRMKCKARLP